jgi:hypothetical protein
MMVGGGRLVAALAGGLVAAGALVGAADAALLRPASGDDRALVEVQWPGPGYGQPGPGYGQEWQGRREHCMHMRERLHEIRYRMEYAPPWERERMGSRLYEIRERLRQECWGHWREDE